MYKNIYRFKCLENDIEKRNAAQAGAKIYPYVVEEYDPYTNRDYVEKQGCIACEYWYAILRAFKDKGFATLRAREVRIDAEKYCFTKSTSNDCLFKKMKDDGLIESVGKAQFVVTVLGKGYLSQATDNYAEVEKKAEAKAKSFAEFMLNKRKKLIDQI